MDLADDAAEPGRIDCASPAEPDREESDGGAEAVPRTAPVEPTTGASAADAASAGAAVRAPLARVGRVAASVRAAAGRVGRRGVASAAAGVGWPARSWAASRARAGQRARRRAAARQEAAAEAVRAQREAATEAARARQEAIARAALARQAAMRQEAARRAALRQAAAQAYVQRLIARDRARRRRRRRLLVGSTFLPLTLVVGLGVGAYYVDHIPLPAELALPESTTVYFSDGRTPMARLGTESRTVLAFDEMSEAVKQAIVAAEDRRFWTHRGVDSAGVLRAAWNNVTGGQTQGASTITQQYARIAASLSGVSYARKSREAMLAWKLERSYSKEEILEFYLNTVPFGRGAYGVEAAAQAYFGKTAKRAAPAAQQLTVAEAMLLAGLVKQPEPDPANPGERPGYDPARGGKAAANAVSRWQYVREGMVALGYLTGAQADALAFPHTVRDFDASASRDGLDRPTGLVVAHVLSELRNTAPFKGKASDHIQNGGFRIVTTVDKRAQDAAEAAADIRRASAPAAVRGQPANWQAALVAVEPGSGRVLAYYGGNKGTGADHAGWFYDARGKARGYGQHPPGSSFKVYVLAEALRQGISIHSRWPSPAVQEFPASGRTRSAPAGPIRNSSTARCQPNCTLWEATAASLNVPFFALTERLGADNVVAMARQAGIESMWAPRGRVDLPSTKDGLFGNEVGIGQYGVTVLDQANGMATFAAGGQRAQAHFVREVTKRGDRVYAERLVQSDTGLSQTQVDELTWTLGKVQAAKLGNGWEAAGKTGTWQSGKSLRDNAHTWMVGYTPALAAAVWLGTADGAALTTVDGRHDVSGSTHAAPIWRQFMTEATSGMGLDPDDRRFRPPPSPTTPQIAGARPR